MPYIALCLLFSTAVLLSIATPLAVPPSTITSPTTLLDSSWTRRVDPPPSTTEFGSSSLSSWGTHHWNPGRRRASQKNKRTPGLDGATSSSSGGFAVHENIVSTFSPPSTDLSSSTSSSPSSTPSLTSLSPTSSGSATAAPASAMPLPSSVPWPQPFDQSLSYSLTGSCVAFLATWLESEDMRGNKTGRMPGVAGNVGKCARPFGLLMTSSSGWASL
ncbi:hypothetical protein QFC19_009168 [Naganishia cerealis]|uniref:Uncharacterized protein n=1 Tax=Naganishia cerealis TaxID=610337 RepID=A0ACC2UWN8_9TREE|nr:hypothetical protein QFC19_009168 [Naganishia cerealis]